MTAEIRVLVPGDEAAATTLTALFADPASVPGDLGRWLADDHNVMVGAWQDGKPAGMAYGYHLARPDSQADMLLLFSIDVAEAYRRQGIGTALVRAFCEQSPGTIWTITNASNEAAMRMYRAAGGLRPNDDDVMFDL